MVSEQTVAALLLARPVLFLAAELSCCAEGREFDAGRRHCEFNVQLLCLLFT